MQLPPLNALRAFESAARHQGFIGAAGELCVTRGAISRHVKLLEQHLGVQLFRRLPQGVALTEAGRRFLPVLTEAFKRIAEEADRIAASGSELRIICPPATSIRWLIPRLDEFRARHPDIRLRLTTDFYGEQGFDEAEFDLGLSVENVAARPPSVVTLPLFPAIISPACAPNLLEGTGRIRSPRDLGRFTLLHDSPSHEDWKTWIEVFEIDGVDPTTGDVFTNLDIAVKAAVLGTGVVMADVTLCRDELEIGTLVLPFENMKCGTPMGRFCLLGGRGKWADPKVEAFKEWVSEVAERDILKLNLEDGILCGG